MNKWIWILMILILIALGVGIYFLMQGSPSIPNGIPNPPVFPD